MALSKLKDNQDIERKIIKIISLINILDRMDLLSPGTSVVMNILENNYSSKNLTTALTDLTEQGIIRKLDNQNSLRIAEHTDVNIDELIKDKIFQRKTLFNTEDTLKSVVGNRAIYPNAYNDDNCITRYFDFNFIDEKKFLDSYNFKEKLNNTKADGIVYGVITTNENYKKVVDALKVFKIERVIFIVSKSDISINDLCIKYDAIKNIVDTNDDEILKLELSYTLNDIKESIDNYIQNYDWWMENMPKYSDSNTMPMMLEVRNNNWTPEKIDKYEELLHHVVKSQLEFFGSKEALAKNLFDTSDRMKMGYNMIRILPYSDADHAARYTCSMQWLLHITLNDLSIVPCHRTSYEQFHIGKFTLDDNGNINGVEAKNVAIGIMTHGFRASTIPKCSGCKYASMCMFGCLGSQYENSGELFSPIDCVCDLMERKIVVLSKEFRDLGLLDIALEKQYITQATYDLYMDMCNEKPKEVPWITVIRNNKPLNK